MEHIEDMFKRMDIQQIREFLLFGLDAYDIENKSYQARLNSGSDAIYKRLESLYPDAKALDEAASDLSQALTAYQYVYMELGMKAGARLICQLLLADDNLRK